MKEINRNQDRASLLSYVTMCFIMLALAACNPAKTQLGEEYFAGINVSLSNSVLTVSNSQVATSNSVDIILRLKDQFGSSYVSSRPVVTFSAVGGTSVGSFSSVINNKNGTYTATFTGVTPGTATAIHAQVNGQEITTSSRPMIQVVVALAINAPTITIPVNSGYTYTFIPSYGVPPYTFSIYSGSGSIDSSGVYTAGTRGALDIVRVTDSIGSTINSSVNLVYSLANGLVSAQVVDPVSGDRYLGGDFTGMFPYPTSYASALNTTTGSPELSFDLQAGFNGSISAIVRDSNTGAIYVGGDFTTYRGVAANRIAKLSAYGALDTSFDPVSATGGFNSSVSALALDSTGTTLYVGGGFTTYRGVTNSAWRIAKLSTSDGALDTTFHPVSVTGGFNSSVAALALDSTGSTLYVGGFFNTYRGVANSARSIAKLSTSDGALDTTFHPVSATGGFNGGVRVLALDSTGNTLFVGGDFGTYRGVANSAQRIAKLSTSGGALDTTFYPVSATGGFNITVRALALDSTGNTLFVGGDFGTYRGVANSARHIAKLSTSDGALDTTFHPVSATGGFGGGVTAFALDSAETTLYVGGAFTTYRGVAANRIAKLSAYGALDTTFHPVSVTGGFDSSVSALALDSTGNTLYVGGGFSTYRGVTNSARKIAKLSTSDGALDTTFHPVSVTGGFDNSVKALALDSTGNTLFVGGDFGSYRGVANSARNISKLSTSDGAIDTTFHPVSATGGFDFYISVLALDSTGSTLYVGGLFATYRGVANSARSIAKLSTSDGALDTTFHPSATGGFTSSVAALALDSTGTTLYVGGSFITYRGVANSAYKIAKLSTSDGALDTTFHPVSATGGFSSNVNALALNATGTTLYVGGYFTTYRSSFLNNAGDLDIVDGNLIMP